MYKELKNQLTGKVNAVVKTDSPSLMCIPFDPANTDYQAYLKYIEQGGLVLPADAGAGTEEVAPE